MIIRPDGISIDPKIKTTSQRKLVGQRLRMSLVANKTAELWKSFMPRRREIINAVSTDSLSMQVYPPAYFTQFAPSNEFEKWAAIEVRDFHSVPEGLETFTLDAGAYAVFSYRGLSSDPRIYQHIFGSWLPNSTFLLDNRPHFEVLGKNYKNNDPESEEEIWIPVKKIKM